MFIDESGEANISKPDPRFNIFVLCGVLFTEDNYTLFDQKSEQSPPPISEPVNDNSNEGVNKHEQNIDTTNKNAEKSYSPPPLIIDKEKWYKGWKRSEVISAVRAGLSFIAICITSYSVSKTVESVAISDSTFKHNRDKDMASAILQGKKDYADSIRTYKADSIKDVERRTAYVKDSISFSMTKKSLDAQINSIKETQKQFKTINEPYLQIDEPEVLLPVGEGIFQIKFSINNYGNFPAKIIKSAINVRSKISPPEIKEIDNGVQKEATANNYVIKGTPLHTVTDSAMYMPAGNYQMLKSGKWNLYIMGYIKYQNLITKKIRAYKYMLRYNVHDNYYDFIYNENFDEGYSKK